MIGRRGLFPFITELYYAETSWSEVRDACGCGHLTLFSEMASGVLEYGLVSTWAATEARLLYS